MFISFFLNCVEIFLRKYFVLWSMFAPGFGLALDQLFPRLENQFLQEAEQCTQVQRGGGGTKQSK